MPTDEDRAAIDARARNLSRDEKEADTLVGLHDSKAAAAAMMALFQLFEEHDIHEVEIDMTRPKIAKDFEIGMLMTPTGILIRRVPALPH